MLLGQLFEWISLYIHKYILFNYRELDLIGTIEFQIGTSIRYRYISVFFDSSIFLMAIVSALVGASLLLSSVLVFHLHLVTTRQNWSMSHWNTIFLSCHYCLLRLLLFPSSFFLVSSPSCDQHTKLEGEFWEVLLDSELYKSCIGN